MHKSRLSNIIIDCQTDDIDAAANFWAAAIGRVAETDADPTEPYRSLEGPPNEMKILVQAVQHESRVHLDIETNDVEAEASRLEKLGAKRVAKMKTWWVMEAPTGQRFCVVRPQRRLRRERECLAELKRCLAVRRSKRLATARSR
ncbi:MAG: VOC family protein [Casimicrobium sp.]